MSIVVDGIYRTAMVLTVLLKECHILCLDWGWTDKEGYGGVTDCIIEMEVSEVETCNAEHPPIQEEEQKLPIAISFPCIKVEPPEVNYVSLCPLFDTSF